MKNLWQPFIVNFVFFKSFSCYFYFFFSSIKIKRLPVIMMESKICVFYSANLMTSLIVWCFFPFFSNKNRFFTKNFYSSISWSCTWTHSLKEISITSSPLSKFHKFSLDLDFKSADGAWLFLDVAIWRTLLLMLGQSEFHRRRS